MLAPLLVLDLPAKCLQESNSKSLVADQGANR